MHYLLPQFVSEVLEKIGYKYKYSFQVKQIILRFKSTLFEKNNVFKSFNYII